jgi:hypothetical protein
MRYDMRPDAVGWTIFDVITGRPVVLEDVVLAELELEAADELVDLLNRADRKQAAAARSAGPGSHTVG